MNVKHLNTSKNEQEHLNTSKNKEKGRRGWQRMSWLEGITDSMDMTLSKLQQTVGNRGTWWAAVQGVSKRWAWLSD